MPRRKAKAPTEIIPRARTQPLESEERETFVRVFHQTFDGASAARVAGYDEPHKAWPALLEEEDIMERLRGYEIGVDEPASSAASILRYLQSQIFKTDAAQVTRDIVTGALRIDLSASAQQDPFLEYEQSIENRGGIEVCRTHIRKSDPARLLRILSQHFEQLEAATGFKEDDMAKAIREINRKGSTAPIRRNRFSQKEPDQGEK